MVEVDKAIELLQLVKEGENVEVLLEEVGNLVQDVLEENEVRV